MNPDIIFLAVAAFVFISIACYYTGFPLPITIMLWLFIMTCGYIGYDYFKSKRTNAKKDCTQKREVNDEINELLDELDFIEARQTEDTTKDQYNSDMPLDEQFRENSNKALKKNNAALIKPAAQIVDKSSPIYTNYSDLNHLNYYTGEGLDCSYDFGFAKDYTNYHDMYMMTGCSGDTKIANRSKFQGMKDKFSKDIRAAYNRTSSQQYFNDELNLEETRHWYENPDIYDSVM